MCQNASFDVALVRHTDRVANGTYSSPSRGPIFGIGFLNAVALRWETLSVGSSFLNCLCLRSFRPFSSFNNPLLNLYWIIACKVVLPMCFSGLFSAFKILLLQLIRSSPRVYKTRVLGLFELHHSKPLLCVRSTAADAH